jgi:hypothetical protein
VQRFSIGRLLRRQWILIVAVFVVAVIAFSVDRLHGIFGSNDVVSRPPADVMDNSNFNPTHVLFEVFGAPGSSATINYLDVHAQPQRVNDATLPWSQTLISTDPSIFADLRALGDGNFIGCRITVDGKVKDERSTQNVNGYVTCLDKSA